MAANWAVIELLRVSLTYCLLTYIHLIICHLHSLPFKVKYCGPFDILQYSFIHFLDRSQLLILVSVTGGHTTVKLDYRSD